MNLVPMHICIYIIYMNIDSCIDININTNITITTTTTTTTNNNNDGDNNNIKHSSLRTAPAEEVVHVDAVPLQEVKGLWVVACH